MGPNLRANVLNGCAATYCPSARAKNARTSDAKRVATSSRLNDSHAALNSELKQTNVTPLAYGVAALPAYAP